MSKTDHLNRYAEGWIKGDTSTIMSALDDEYQLDDPNDRVISKVEFPDYHAGFKSLVESIRGASENPCLDIGELVTNEDSGVLIAWCWWTIPGTPVQGSGLIKVGDDGVISERLTYYTKLS